MESKKKVVKQDEIYFLIVVFFFKPRVPCQAVVQCVLLLQLPIFTMELLLATPAGINPVSYGVDEDRHIYGGYNNKWRKNKVLD
jgi:hypothetical protein